jgi:hypothetical protein
MDRINGERTIDIGSGRRGFRQKNAGLGVAGTELTALWFNAVQEELLHLIEAAGLEPDPDDWTQISAAITTMITNAALSAASVSEILQKVATKVLRVDRLWDAGVFVALTDAATIALDLQTGLNFSVTLGGNRTLGAATHLKEGQSGIVKVSQDGTGGRTLSFGSGYKFFDGLTPDLNTAANAVNLLHYEVVPGSIVAVSYIRGLA